MPKGNSLSIYARFSGKKRISLYISRKKGARYYIQTRHNDRFSRYNLFLRKARVHTEQIYWIVLKPPGHALKSN